MAKRVGVVLSGCGANDGSEIHEAVITLLAIDRQGAQAVCMAPNIDQMEVVNHLTGEPTQERRNVLVEAARIARGNVQDIAKVKVSDLDAVILPGGFGAAKNLSTFAVAGAECDIDPAVSKLLRDALGMRKPIGVMCIAPAVLARALRDTSYHVTLTVGNDADTAVALEKLGSRHQSCAEGDIVVDPGLRVVSTPAYMYDSRISTVARGIERLVSRVLEMT